jgi:cobalt/nickel transport system permease protein
MHLPDAVLNLSTNLTVSLSAAAITSFCYLRSTRNRKSISTAALAATFALATQMANFPISIGVSAHVLGCAVSAILLGPALATLAITTALFAQAFILHDGGITALGANIFNMGIVAVWVGWASFHLMGGNKRTILSAAVAGWLSVMAAAICCSIELIASGIAPSALIFSFMLKSHAIIGLFEAILCSLIIYSLRKNNETSPDFMSAFSNPSRILILSSVGFLLLTPFACRRPDSLEFLLNSLK